MAVKKVTKKATPKKVEEVVETPVVEEAPVLTVEVETANGVKVVNGTDAAEVADQVEATKAEKFVVQPDINSAAHANKTYSELQEG